MMAYAFYESDNRIRRYAEALVRRGDQVDIISLSLAGRIEKSEINGVRIYTIQKRKINEKGKFDYLFRTSLFLFRSFFFLTKLHFINPYQLVHVHSVPDYEIFAAFLAKLFGAKIILDIHDIVPEFYAGKFNENKATLTYKVLIWVEKLCCSFSDHVIISNDIWADKITARSVSKDKCLTILNYPDPHIFTKRNTYKDSNAPFTLIYPGTLNWHQGLDLAVEAMVEVRKKFPNTELHIYGRGPEEKNLMALAGSLGLSEAIKFKGSISLEEVAIKIETADAGIVPKRADGFGNEAFSTKVFEFMTLGVPAIVSKTKIDQYYFNDSLVLFFEPGNADDLADKISLAIQDKELRSRLTQNALPFVKNNSWEVKKDIYLQLVDSLVTRT